MIKGLFVWFFDEKTKLILSQPLKKTRRMKKTQQMVIFTE